MTDSSSVEVLATKASNGSVTIMMANHAVKSSGDNNGLGAPRTLVVEAPTGFSSATLLTIDATTNTAQGPTAAPVPLSGHQAIVLSGYGVAFLTLTP